LWGSRAIAGNGTRPRINWGEFKRGVKNKRLEKASEEQGGSIRRTRLFSITSSQREVKLQNSTWQDESVAGKK